MNFNIKWQWLVALAALTLQSISATEVPAEQKEVNREENGTTLAEEITKIVEEFNKWTLLLSPSVITSSNPSKIVEICVVSKQELDLIIEILQDSKRDNVNQEYQIVASSQCSQIDKIKKGILKLKHDFRQMVKEPISNAKYDELKSLYESQLQQLKKHMDDAITSLTADEKDTFEQLLNMLDELQAQEGRINKILKKLEENRGKPSA